MNATLSPQMPLDPSYKPASLMVRQFQRNVEQSANAQDFAICVEKPGEIYYTFYTKIFKSGAGHDEENFKFVERLTKTLLWIVGGYKIILSDPEVSEKIKNAYAKGGLREFDWDFMSGIYDREFVVESLPFDQIPRSSQCSASIGGHLDGCRIGFDAGGSDRKVSAVIDGKVVFSEEVVWHPKINSDPQYHYDGITEAFRSAAGHMPRVDAIGVSSAGIYLDNRTRAASLFLKVSRDDFDSKVKDIYINAAKIFGDIPLAVANDGDVTALAGAMEIMDNALLGIAMGTSQAAGYINASGGISGWLNELAFVPVDWNESAAVDEWSGDYGCGVKYFSQDAVIRLANQAGIEFDEKSSPAERLKLVQQLHEKDSGKVDAIFETIGIYLGYTIAYYAMFYEIKHILILGRVTSGRGGPLILSKAREVLKDEFPELDAIKLHLPDESNRRVGQSIAAASLPRIKK